MGVYNQSRRIFYLDLLRVIAIFAVVLSHVAVEFTKNFNISTLNWYGSVFHLDFGIIGVPIFLMISGALLLNKDYTISNFLNKRFIRILLPFVFYGLMLPIIKMKFMGYPWTITEYFELFFFNQYWFVWMIIGAYLIIPILNSFIKEHELKGLEYLIIL